MKALVKAHDEPGLWLQEMQKPEPGPEDVLIKVNEVAICGTDLHIYNWDQWAQEHVPVPMIVGHEYIGIIEAIGELCIRSKSAIAFRAKGISCAANVATAAPGEVTCVAIPGGLA